MAEEVMVVVPSDVTEELNKLSIAEGEEAKKIITLKIDDDMSFEVERYIVEEMEMVQSFVNTYGDAESIIFPHYNVNSGILRYCEEHYGAGAGAGAGARAGDLKEFDKKLMEELSHKELKELFLAANYLNMKNLLDFVSKSIVAVIQNKSLEFVRNFFGFVSDFTVEEEVGNHSDSAWSFEGVDAD